MTKHNVITSDLLIIGSGLTGLFAAFKAAEFGTVTIITKTDFSVSSSWLAQGGIAAAISDGDSTHLHFNDTIKAGRGLCDEEAVKILVEEGKYAVENLLAMGMPFDSNNEGVQFGLEGGHSKRRILHSGGSSTGEQLVKFMISNLPEKISVYERTQAMELIVDAGSVHGAHAVKLESGETVTFLSSSTIIASGGYGRVYSRCTNPVSAVGDGIWLALNAGAVIRDLEFVQFHPTSFYSSTGETFLISEAVRGEGAYLLDENERRFMPNYHKQAELAPRDVVARAIHNEIRNSDKDYVYLDLRHLPAKNIKDRFPNIFRWAKEFSVDITTDLVPVAPAVHYSIGGIKTDLNGKTNLRRLFAAGEAASTGVHGANRLASNSLLECLVFAERAVKSAASFGGSCWNFNLGELDFKHFDIINEKAFESVYVEISKILFRYAGIVRTAAGLYSGLSRLSEIREKFHDSPASFEKTFLIGRLQIAEGIFKSALARKESRGAHYRADFPDSSSEYLGHFEIDKTSLKFEKKEVVKFELY